MTNKQKAVITIPIQDKYLHLCSTVITMLRRLVIFLQVLALSRQNVISLAQGLVRGVAFDGYIAYTGIPYAAVSSGKDRFKVNHLL